MTHIGYRLERHNKHMAAVRAVQRRGHYDRVQRAIAEHRLWDRQGVLTKRERDTLALAGGPARRSRPADARGGPGALTDDNRRPGAGRPTSLRACICCGKTFPSAGPGNWLCNECRKLSDGPYDPGVGGLPG